MRIYKIMVVLFAISTLAALAGCPSASRHQLLKANESQVKIRNMQTRAFDTTDKNKTLRTAIATLQDLGFVIDKADELLGSISATKFVKKYAQSLALKITISVRPRGNNQLLVRANAQLGISAIEEPEIYQNFFNALSKSMFLTAHNVD